MQLKIPVQADGLILTVLVGLDHQETAILASNGKPIPAPLWAKGIIDTGSNITCVSGTALQALGLSPRGYGSTQTASGAVPVRLFQVSLGLPLVVGKPPTSQLLAGQLTVMELSHAISDVQVLVGLDVLLTGKLLLDGPGREFELDF